MNYSMKDFFVLKLVAIIALSILISGEQGSAQSVTATIPIGLGSYAVAVNPNTNRIYIAQWRPTSAAPGWLDCLVTVDGANNSVIQTSCFDHAVPGEEWVQSIAVNPTTNRVYFGTNKRIIVINGETNAVVAEIPNVDAYDMVVNPLTNRIYIKSLEVLAQVIDGNTNQVISTLSTIWADNSRGAVVINPVTNRLYVRGAGIETWHSLPVFDTTTDNWLLNLEALEVPIGDIFDLNTSGFAVNTRTNQLWFQSTYLMGFAVYSAADSDKTQGMLAGGNLSGGGMPMNLAVNPNSNHAYISGLSDTLGVAYANVPVVWAVDGATYTETARIQIGNTEWSWAHGIAVNPSTNRVYAANPDDGNLYVISGESSGTPIGADVMVQASGATLTFDNVVSEGITTVEPIEDPAQAGQIPGGFAVSESLAFEIGTAATFSGPVTSCFDIPNVNTESEFLALRVLHRELNTATSQYELVDRTTSHDFADRKICATTTSFSKFYLARVGSKVSALFDQTRAYRAGSTIPVKVRMLDTNDQNISASNLPLTVRGLRRIGSATSSTVTDAGNSNADNEFRYESGAGRYIYNLQTTGLAAGKYVLSFYAGAERSFFYNVEFQVR